jgi:hypothetical protein
MIFLSVIFVELGSNLALAGIKVFDQMMKMGKNLMVTLLMFLVLQNLTTNGENKQYYG